MFFILCYFKKQKKIFSSVLNFWLYVLTRIVNSFLNDQWWTTEIKISIPKSKYQYWNRKLKTEITFRDRDQLLHGLLLTTIISEGSKIRHSLCLRAAPPIRLPKLKNKKIELKIRRNKNGNLKTEKILMGGFNSVAN